MLFLLFARFSFVEHTCQILLLVLQIVCNLVFYSESFVDALEQPVLLVQARAACYRHRGNAASLIALGGLPLVDRLLEHEGKVPVVLLVVLSACFVLQGSRQATEQQARR